MQEKRYHTIFDSPQNYPGQYDFYAQGASPKILSFLQQFLKDRADELSEIYISIFLYNNKFLHQSLKELAQKGVKIHLVTIPIEGYDHSNPRIIHDLISGEAAYPAAQSKYSLARPIFAEFYKTPIGYFDLYLFPHLSIRSPQTKAFSKGQYPYSLHLKSFLFLYKNGGGAVGLSSSNLAVRDLVKEENLLLVENDWDLLKTSLRFFQQLLENAIHIRDFDFKNRYINFPLQVQELNQQERNFFIAPFYKNSPVLAEKFLVENTKKAQQRIYLVAQHISSYEYTVNGRFHSDYEEEDIEHYGFLRTVLERAGAGVDVRCISQTFYEDNKNNESFRKPDDVHAFQKFFQVLKATANTSYAVNDNIHSKYIIIDDLVIVTTCNFTPTQFIYLNQVDIPSFEHNPEESYQGIFSEVGQFMKISDATCFNTYLQNFEQLWKNPATVVVKV